MLAIPAAPAPLEDLEPIFLVLIKGRDDRRAGLAGLGGFRAGGFCFQPYALRGYSFVDKKGPPEEMRSLS